MWLSAASTGVRRSELLGVRWADVDLVAATVTIRQTVVEGEHGHRPEEDQKTTTSARTIHLARRTVEVLRAHRESQAELRRGAGVAWEDRGLVFTQPNGAWWHPDSVSSAFRRAVKAAGVPVIRLQDVRHTHASLLLKAGINSKVVSERLGHRSVAFTLDTYAHVMPGMQPDAAELFMKLVLGDATAEGPDDADDSPKEEGDVPV
ncbi:MAG TPA: site-specific integrase [Egibacteraceae bacterium]|nr:site-specific integrase [Egibacteraceae bacterium]